MNDIWQRTLPAPVELLGQQILAVLPDVLAMTAVLVGGLLVAWATGYLVERLLRAVGLDRLCDRLGLGAALLRGGVKTDPSRLAGRIATGRWRASLRWPR